MARRDACGVPLGGGGGGAGEGGGADGEDIA